MNYLCNPSCIQIQGQDRLGVGGGECSAVQCSLGRHSLPFLPSLAAASIRPTASDTTRCHCQAAPAFFCLLVALLLFRFGGHLRDFRDFRNLGFLGFVRESSWEIGRWKEREQDWRGAGVVRGVLAAEPRGCTGLGGQCQVLMEVCRVVYGRKQVVCKVRVNGNVMVVRNVEDTV